MKSNEWESGLKKGRVKKYMHNKYGSKAFNRNGTLKVSFLKAAQKSTDNKSMKKALTAAITLKGLARRRRK